MHFKQACPRYIVKSFRDIILIYKVFCVLIWMIFLGRLSTVYDQYHSGHEKEVSDQPGGSQCLCIYWAGDQ